MSELVQQLWERYVADHPMDAAIELEKCSSSEAAEALGSLPPHLGGRAGLHMVPRTFHSAIGTMPPESAAPLLATLPSPLAASVLRCLPEETRRRCLQNLEEKERASIQLILNQTEESAGALMDPDYPAVAEDLTVAEVTQILRKSPVPVEEVFFVLERDRRICGQVPLKLLATSAPDRVVGSLKRPVPSRLFPDWPVERLASNRDLAYQHVLPVVDDADRFLGGLREDALREWYHRELLDDASFHLHETGRAMGELFHSGVLGFLHAFSSRNSQPTTGTSSAPPPSSSRPS